MIRLNVGSRLYFPKEKVSITVIKAKGQKAYQIDHKSDRTMLMTSAMMQNISEWSSDKKHLFGLRIILNAFSSGRIDEETLNYALICYDPIQSFKQLLWTLKTIRNVDIIVDGDCYDIPVFLLGKRSVE